MSPHEKVNCKHLAVDRCAYGMKKQTSSETLLNKAEAAVRLGLSLRGLDRRIKHRTVPFIKLGRLVKFIPSDLDRFLKDHKLG
jgi:hypothetical protein